ncbi:integrase catalytic domain-containing protein [Trichonephila clavipes]|nr:integrase catalytic domain-containing protein [Trichonephila clavipes]
MQTKFYYYGPEVIKTKKTSKIYSVNGTNFRGAYNELVDIDWNEVSRYAEIQRITWIFIPPTAVRWGGFRERLVRTAKELFRRTLGKAIFTYEEFLTILCECEKVVNSHPLTYLSEDLQDLTPIKPARFLFEIPTADTKDLDVRDANHFQKRLGFRAKVIEELKRRFKNEYLGQLIQRQKQHPQSSNIQVGDIVLIGDDWKNRLQWPLARVIKLIPGKVGLVGTIKLKTQSCTLTRPIQCVFPLEGYQVRGVYDALLAICNNLEIDNSVRVEASGLLNCVKQLKFLCCIVIWYKILNCINPISKLLQTEDYDLPSAMEFLTNRKDFFKDLRLDTALNEMLCYAREFPDKIDIPAKFELTQRRHRVQRRNVNFDYEARDDQTEDPTLKYKAEFIFSH